jgi:hypothetical protein
MLTLGLSATELQEYHVALLNSRPMRVRFFVLDKNEDVIADASDTNIRVIEASIQVDNEQTISRQLSLSIVDPERRLHLDPEAPSRTALFTDRFMRIVREDWVSGLDRWVGCPVFHGPITKLDEDGWIIRVEAMGKEYLMLDPAVMWTSRTFRKGERITTVIRKILEMRGEKRITLPTMTNRLNSDLTITGMSQGWKVISNLAHQTGYHVFYDGDGYFRMRRRPGTSVYRFSEGSNVLTRPIHPYDITTLRNVIQVLGPKPKQGRRIIRTARAPAADVSSPESLSRNGKPRFLVERIQSDHARKGSEAQEVADRALRDRLRIGGEVSFEALPAVHLEELDVVTLETDIAIIPFALKRFSPPITTTSMSIGFLKRSRVQKRIKT